MSKRAELLKSIIKGSLNESPSLDKYLRARGINPEFVSKDVKVAHSKSLAFLSWQKAHQNEEVQLESVDKEDTITFDIPLLIRMLEYAREDAKTDMDLHKVVKKLIAIRDQGTLTMDDYEFVTKIKEEFNAMNEKKDPCWSGYTMVGMKKKGGRDVPNCVPAGGVTKAKGFKEDIDEINEKKGPCWTGYKKVTGKKDFEKGSCVKEEMTKEMSKSARIIKSIYKKKGVKEELYDHEKEDKSVKGYGKKPKMNSVNTAFGEAPKASAVLSGGTTMTGQKRDTVEIDPMMRGKPNGRFGDQKPPKN